MKSGLNDNTTLIKVSKSSFSSLTNWTEWNDLHKYGGKVETNASESMAYLNIC